MKINVIRVKCVINAKQDLRKIKFGRKNPQIISWITNNFIILLSLKYLLPRDADKDLRIYCVDR